MINLIVHVHQQNLINSLLIHQNYIHLNLYLMHQLMSPSIKHKINSLLILHQHNIIDLQIIHLKFFLQFQQFSLHLQLLYYQNYIIKSKHLHFLHFSTTLKHNFHQEKFLLQVFQLQYFLFVQELRNFQINIYYQLLKYILESKYYIIRVLYMNYNQMGIQVNILFVMNLRYNFTRKLYIYQNLNKCHNYFHM